MTPRLLLVEDDPASRAFLAAASESLPATVDVADSIASAIALATQHRHALWMIDANLPDGTGADLLDALRNSGLDTPALAHTAACEQRELDALLAAGFAAAVSKPLPAESWRDALRSMLARQAPHVAEIAAEPSGSVESPLWDDGAALAAMNGNRTHVDALRGLFRAELSTIQATMHAAFAGGDTDAMLSTLHKLRASCGFVGAKRLDAAASRLRASTGSEDARRDFLATLQDTLSS
ncbi:MAG: response regulator [Luteimonas sp.]|nr:response regulator [Luteimonas sp.]